MIENEFMPEVECDDCARMGSYLVDGRCLCVYCLNACIEADDLYEYEEEDLHEDEEYNTAEIWED